jgi:hypothetical protein
MYSPLGLLDWRAEQRLGAITNFPATDFPKPSPFWVVASIASGAASAYHGSKRHGGSVIWGLVWGLAGGLFPVVTPAIGAAQGFGVCKFDCRR